MLRTKILRILNNLFGSNCKKEKKFNLEINPINVFSKTEFIINFFENNIHNIYI